MATYKYTETNVKIDGEWVTIKSGDIVIKDGNKYRFDSCTYQFERWDLLQEGRCPRPINWEGGMITAERKVA